MQRHSFASFLLTPENCENSALTPILLLFGLVFRPSLKIFDTQLTQVPAAKDVAELTSYNSQADILIELKNHL